MEERLNELDDPSYQLMMDIQTGRVVDTSRPRRVWKLLGLLTLALGGLTGLLLVGGNHASDTITLPPATLSPVKEHLPQTGLREPQRLTDTSAHSELSQQDGPLGRQALQDSGSGDVKRFSKDKGGGGARNLSSSPKSIFVPKPANTRLTQARERKRQSDRLHKERPRKVVQRHSAYHPWRSLMDDFDPNAELVRSAP